MRTITARSLLCGTNSPCTTEVLTTTFSQKFVVFRQHILWNLMATSLSLLSSHMTCHDRICWYPPFDNYALPLGVIPRAVCKRWGRNMPSSAFLSFGAPLLHYQAPHRRQRPCAQQLAFRSTAAATHPSGPPPAMWRQYRWCACHMLLVCMLLFYSII